jgi:hypothetical protein
VSPPRELISRTTRGQFRALPTDSTRRSHRRGVPGRRLRPQPGLHPGRRQRPADGDPAPGCASGPSVHVRPFTVCTASHRGPSFRSTIRSTPSLGWSRNSLKSGTWLIAATATAGQSHGVPPEKAATTIMRSTLTQVAINTLSQAISRRSWARPMWSVGRASGWRSRVSWLIELSTRRTGRRPARSGVG